MTGARVLVIEDNAANMELMVYLLGAFGYSTLTAQDGRAGLAAAQREHPDLILCDMQMPVMNGYEVARALKADARLRDIPLIAVTAFAMVDDRQKALAAGFDGYLAKPIAPDSFVQQVAEFLRPSQRRARAPDGGSTAAGTAVSSKGATMLVVDDRPVNLEFALSLFGGSGYRVVTARGMQDALRAAREAFPDLILSDVCMADGSGYDFIRAVKADPRLRPIPFIFVTSTMTGELERDRGLALGAARYLFRPIEPQDLLREIESCLAGSGKG